MGKTRDILVVLTDQMMPLVVLLQITNLLQQIQVLVNDSYPIMASNYRG